MDKIKAIISAPPKHELAAIKHIVNRDLFRVASEAHGGYVHHEKKEEVEVEGCEGTLLDDELWGRPEERVEVEATIQLEDGGYVCEPTIQLDAPACDATLNLDQPTYGLEPTIQLD